MDIRKYLAEKAETVNEGLKSLLPKEDEYPQTLHKAMHYSLFAGGKRIRPVLVLAASEAVGGDPSNALAVACAFECVHTYSLIHDDLPAIDNDDLRRGRPTCHKAFGEAAAILAGDALLTAAFDLVARTPSKDASLAAKVIRELSRAAGSTGMIGGQMVDIESEGKEISFPVLEYIHIHKTGELILAALRSGAILGGADDLALQKITRYGKSVGLAFQIADDILDVEGASEVTGKPVGGDEKKGKATYPALMGLEESKKRAKELVDIAVSALDGFDSKADPLREIAGFIVARDK
ncbi:MAG: polyprenyl synthetase [Deltaproteobacteria bacterium GWC2_56_8]|nr:MAG: polyprenyl synthetase [Deltaproteobacteria bacterium GWB2_55_19]OGP38888.1 MAG: polyprenyl synthetase [Deltaproteobacteria bacterium GWC2_56_8]HAO94379.1 polyprenyl synthetase [Deltaproteobacteria bacterium]